MQPVNMLSVHYLSRSLQHPSLLALCGSLPTCPLCSRGAAWWSLPSHYPSSPTQHGSRGAIRWAQKSRSLKIILWIEDWTKENICPKSIPRLDPLHPPLVLKRTISLETQNVHHHNHERTLILQRREHFRSPHKVTSTFALFWIWLFF